MPVFGAGTSNSEFEFLSGDSISFLLIGWNVYQSYIKDTVPSRYPPLALVIPRPHSIHIMGMVGTAAMYIRCLALTTISALKILSIRINPFWIPTNKIMMSCSMKHCFVNAIRIATCCCDVLSATVMIIPWWKICLKAGSTSKPFFLFMLRCKTMVDTQCPTQTLHRKFMNKYVNSLSESQPLSVSGKTLR